MFRVIRRLSNGLSDCAHRASEGVKGIKIENTEAVILNYAQNGTPEAQRMAVEVAYNEAKRMRRLFYGAALSTPTLGIVSLKCSSAMISTIAYTAIPFVTPLTAWGFAALAAVTGAAALTIAPASSIYLLYRAARAHVTAHRVEKMVSAAEAERRNTLPLPNMMPPAPQPVQPIVQQRASFVSGGNRNVASSSSEAPKRAVVLQRNRTSASGQAAYNPGYLPWPGQ